MEKSRGTALLETPALSMPLVSGITSLLGDLVNKGSTSSPLAEGSRNPKK